jgi:major membrane immunogen (membrane-anchored lipoprotein)
MKKILLLTLLLLSSFILVGCGNNESEKKDDLIKIDGTVKKTKYKKLICKSDFYDEGYMGSVTVVIDYNTEGKPTKFYETLSITYDEDVYNKFEEPKEEKMKDIAKQLENSFLEGNKEYNMSHTNSVNKNIIEANFTSEDPNLLKESGDLETEKENCEKAGHFCFVQDVEF